MRNLGKILVSARVIAALAIVIVIITAIYLDHQLTYNRHIRIVYPFQQTLFPKEIASPTLYWSDNNPTAKAWKISVDLASKKNYLIRTTTSKSWRPDQTCWDSIKLLSSYKPITLRVERFNPSKNYFFNDKADVSIIISKDEVGAPILYRTIPLPTFFAEKNIKNASYDLCNIASYSPPHVVLGSFNVCGNCHSFTGDGKTIALDFDAVKRDKGGYFVAKVDSQILFDKVNYMSWSKLQGKNTFGLLSKISWDGRYIITTIKDRVIFKRFMGWSQDSVAYSQLFFPVNGTLAVYDRKTNKFWELPGASDTAYVQSNAIWTPDDKYIIFARAKGLPYPDKKSYYNTVIEDENLINDFVHQRKNFRYDLYRVPFNDGKGGTPEPIVGASNNGKSNYFPAISHDGKWLVYCQASNFMMLRPDSRLYIIPAQGGTARKLECNLPSMNSWHSWSPNGKWLVFSSKAFDINTDIYLTHIDENGNATHPVLLQIFKRANCAINYPEFLKRDPNLPINMTYKYINTDDIKLAIDNKDFEGAKHMLTEYFAQSSTGLMPIEYTDVSEIYKKLGNLKESEKYAQLGKEAELKFNRGF